MSDDFTNPNRWETERKIDLDSFSRGFEPMCKVKRITIDLCYNDNGKVDATAILDFCDVEGVKLNTSTLSMEKNLIKWEGEIHER